MFCGTCLLSSQVVGTRTGFVVVITSPGKRIETFPSWGLLETSTAAFPSFTESSGTKAEISFFHGAGILRFTVLSVGNIPRFTLSHWIQIFRPSLKVIFISKSDLFNLLLIRVIWNRCILLERFPELINPRNLWKSLYVRTRAV